LQTELAFFSKETNLPKGRRTVEETPKGDTVVDVYFRKWEPVGKLFLFHTVIYSLDGKQVTITLDQIEVDQVDDSLFELPNQVKKLRDQQ
jgi:outer membrane lipoprotein-sorting protein